METGLILASRSERRQELLAQVGISYKVVEAQIEEYLPEEVATEYAVVKLARDKAAWVEERFPENWILAADTVVALGDSIFQKPMNKAEAIRMLQRLSGRSHEVFTGYCLRNRSLDRTREGVARTVVTMKLLSNMEIKGYVKTGEPMDKAGAYAIQGLGAMFITRIYGSYTNVVGLPLAEIVALLMEEGVASPWERK
jgi:septum formation protein